jgi:2Fe-2S ferredoxin
MGSLTVTLTDVNGRVRVIADAAEGQSLMEVAKTNDVEGIGGDCGGGCACATCHVYIDPAWWEQVGAPDDIEFSMLDMAGDILRDTSRLACQIKLRAALDGLTATVAPSGL